MILNYDKATVEVQRRLIRVSKTNLRESVFATITRQKKHRYKSKYDGFIYQKLNENNTRLIYIDLSGFEKNERNKMQERYAFSEMIEKYQNEYRKKGNPNLANYLVEKNLFNNASTAHMYLKAGHFSREEVNIEMKKFLEQYIKIN